MKRLGLAGLMCLSINSVFAVDPVLHTLDAPFPTQASTSGTLNATYTFTNNLPWAFKKPFHVIPVVCPVPTQGCTASSDEFQYNDRCSGKLLQPKEQCTYSISLSPKTPGQKTV